MKGAELTVLLQTSDGVVRSCKDTYTNTYSIGLRTNNGFLWKDISKELNDLLVKELRCQQGVEGEGKQ
jgi:glucose/arabinose dehydrogenase